MPTPITLPQLAETTHEGTVGRWLKQVGDTVKRYEPLVEILTDKVNVEMTSPYTGVITAINVAEGETLLVGGVLATVDEDGSTAEAAPAPAPAAAAPAAAAAVATAEGPGSVRRGEGRQRITPVVARLAQQHGVDIGLLQGTGVDGRVTKQDLLDYVAQQEQQPATAPVAAPAPAAAPAAPVAAGPDEEAVPLSPMRRAIAENMSRSKASIPHAWAMVEVDVSPLVRLREGLKEDFKRREGVDLTYLPFVMKVVAETLKEFPYLNAAWADDKIILKKRINLGVAVSLDNALIVPVVKDADRLSIAGLAHAVADLINKARSNRLAPADVTGGTFTVNNTGALGTSLSYPIVFPGQAAIVTTEAIIKRPVVVDDAIAIRSMMNIAMSFDHRIADGGITGGFLRALKTKVERLSTDTPIY